MKAIVLLCLLLLFPRAAVLGAVEPDLPMPDELSKKDQFQAGQWIRIIRGLWLTGDYVLMREYCLKTVLFYPGTMYAAEAQAFLEKSASPRKNRRRKFIRDNPGLIPGL
ncbi:MAG: hypothetical protein HY543_03285 [Deltaproteobacteria bacterium]|nr:hypothetical protein [Deltaproteobacteria bacterium]